MVQKAFTGGEEHIIDVGFDLLGETAVATDTQFQIRTVVAYHIDLGGGEFVAVLFVHPAFYRLHDLGVEETVDMVVASCVATIRTEIASVESAFKRHAEVVAL